MRFTVDSLCFRLLSTWRIPFEAAGQISKDLGKWDAMKRSAFFQDAARERVVQVQRSARFRAAGRCVARASGALAALVWSEKPSATRALMQWQEASRLPQEVTHNEVRGGHGMLGPLVLP